MASVVLPRSLVALVPGTAHRMPDVPGASVVEVLRALDARAPGLLDRVCDPGPTIRRHLNVFVDGERAAIDTPVAPTSVVHVIPAVSGG